MYLPRNVAVLICLVLTIVVCVSGQDTQAPVAKTHASKCELHKTCDRCISTPYCQWCSEDRPMNHDESTKTKSSGTGRQPRCIDNRVARPKDWCRNETSIINPIAEHKETQDDNFSVVEGEEIQLRPQKLNVKLRVDKAEKVKIKYQQALDYPVDLYFLMDLSFSMEDHRDNLSGLGETLAKAMMSITSNFRLGFGSFVDKYILPMTSTQPEWLNNYCKLKDGRRCATPYDFQHQMNLTKNYESFKARVNAAPISGNIDTPEGGLDGLMQAMVCDIGWRPKARHIIVYSSDATYHIAGDGRLAGLIEPNDEQCHLNEKGLYDHAEILDYPSISQIKKIALDKSKSIIFAVTEDVKTDYNELSDYINPGLGVGTLSRNSDDVVKLVKTFTEKLTSNIKMVDRIDEKYADMFKIDYEAKYTGGIEDVVCKKNNCSGVSVKTPIEFEVSIKALRCPEVEAERHPKIELELEGIPEKVVIDVDIICSCGCEREPNSPTCSNHGDLTCGVCECKPDYEHDDCSCQVQNLEFGSTDKCKAPESNLTCSGHGVCNSCGTCMCHPGPDGDTGKKYYGDFCECDNFSCPRANINNMPCGGPERGECLCKGKCECKPGYEGESCGCRTQDECIAPGETEPCGGFGECECGVCQCTKDNRRSGKYCEQCTICVNQLCDKYKDCVECLAYQSGPKYAENENCLSCTDIEFAGKVENLNETVNGTNYCTLLDSATCVFAFTYEERRGDAGKMLVRAEKDKKCPAASASPITVAISAIVVTLFLGLLGLIIWKILTMYHDHREWVKFEKERACAKWERGDNPLFKDPTTRTANPIFEQQSTK